MIKIFELNQIRKVKSINNLNRFFGELIHIARPFLYLLLINIYGDNSFKPYIINIFMDFLRINFQE